MSDPFDLQRFVRAQQHTYEAAREELRAGRKTGHWMWFIFPQIQGLGFSAMAQQYAISNLEEAAAYVSHPTLGPRLLECAHLVEAIEGRSAYQVFSTPDDMKLRSSMTLFARVPHTDPIFQAVLDKFFGGEPDPKTIERL